MSDEVWLRGIVREWSTEHGVGVLDSVDTPGGCWVHSTMIHMAPPRTLVVGREVSFTAEQVTDQDGYRWRAGVVVPEGAAPDLHRTVGPSAAYRSTLTITFDDESGR